MHACLLDSSSTRCPPPVFCQRLRFPSSPLSHLLHDGSSSSSSTCLLFFPSGGERANKQNQQNWIPCACMCQYLLQCVDSEGSCKSLSYLSRTTLAATCYGARPHWCLSDKKKKRQKDKKTMTTKYLAAL